jgi:hypothetical protein
LAVQQGFEALYTVQELQHLMSSPVVASNALAVEEIRHEMDQAVALLSEAFGIRQAAAGLQVGHEFPGFDGRHLAAILQTSMGKKLLSRGLKLLPPLHRWKLVPLVVARIMISNPTSTSGASSSGSYANDNVLLERKLLKTIIEFLQYSYQHHKTLQANSRSGGPVDPSAALKFADELLNNLRECLKNIIVSQMEKNQLRESLLAERTRAEIMNVVVEVGDQVYPASSPKVAEDWQQTRDAFMSLLEN